MRETTSRAAIWLVCVLAWPVGAEAVVSEARTALAESLLLRLEGLDGERSADYLMHAASRVVGADGTLHLSGALRPASTGAERVANDWSAELRFTRDERGALVFDGGTLRRPGRLVTLAHRTGSRALARLSWSSFSERGFDDVGGTGWLLRGGMELEPAGGVPGEDFGVGPEDFGAGPEDVGAPEDFGAPEDVGAPEDFGAPEELDATVDVGTPEDVGAPPGEDFGGPPPVEDFGGPPPVEDFGGPPPVEDVGGPPPVEDAGPPPVEDAGPPPGEDAGPPPGEDAGPPPGEDAGPPPGEDAGPPPGEDAGPPPGEDAGPPPGEDAGPPPGEDAGPPPVEDVGAPPNPDVGSPPNEDAGPPPVEDVGAPPSPDAGPPPVEDAAPPVDDAEPPPVRDAGLPPVRDAALPVEDAAVPPVGDAGPPAPDVGGRDAEVDGGPDLDATPPDADVGPDPDATPHDAAPDADVHVPDVHLPDAYVPDACAPDACTCDAPPNTTFSANFAIPEEPFNKKLRLPFINKKVGVDLQATLEGEGQKGTCANDCTSNISVTGRGEAGAAFGIIEVTAALTGNGSWERERCKVCDPATCEESCEDIVCTKKSGSLEGEVNVTRTFGLPTSEWSKGPFSVKIGCNAKAGVTVTGGAGGSIDTPGPGGECTPCDACTDVFATAGLGVDGSGGCGLDLSAWRYERHFGCFDCLSAGASVQGRLARRFGAGAACNPSRTCVSVTGRANAGANLDKCLAFRWFNVKVGCGFEVHGEATFDSCGAGDRGGDLDFSCSVKATWAGDCDEPCCKMCGRGKACGNTCIARWKTCRTPRGCACNNQ